MKHFLVVSDVSPGFFTRQHRIRHAIQPIVPAGYNGAPAGMGEVNGEYAIIDIPPLLRHHAATGCQERHIGVASEYWAYIESEVVNVRIGVEVNHPPGKTGSGDRA